MGQFDVHRNQGPRKGVIPYILVVQSARFDAAGTRVVIPMVRQSAVRGPDPILNPVFEIEGNKVVINPLQMVSVAADRLGERVASLKASGDRVIAAIDQLISRAWD